MFHSSEFTVQSLAPDSAHVVVQTQKLLTTSLAWTKTTTQTEPVFSFSLIFRTQVEDSSLTLWGCDTHTQTHTLPLSHSPWTPVLKSYFHKNTRAAPQCFSAALLCSLCVCLCVCACVSFWFYPSVLMKLQRQKNHTDTKCLNWNIQIGQNCSAVCTFLEDYLLTVSNMRSIQQNSLDNLLSAALEEL